MVGIIDHKHMAKQTTLSGGFLLPPAKRRAPDDSCKFKESWKESALWPKANVCVETTTLPSSWLQLAKDGMVCSLCTKYNKVPRSGKPIWLE